MGLRIIVAHHRYRSALPSGENTIVDQEVAGLRAAGVDVAEFFRDSDQLPVLPLAEKATLPFAPIWAPVAQRELAALIKVHRPHAIHLHNPYPLLSPWIVRTAHRFEVPVVQSAHNYRHSCPSGVFYRDGAVCHDCDGRRVALPALKHRCYRGSAAQSAVMVAALAAHRRTWLKVDAYIAPTQAMAAHLRRCGVAPTRITVKPNAVQDPGEPSAEPGEGVLFAGRLAAEKGLPLLLEAWVPELGRLKVAGDGNLRDQIESRAEVDYLGKLDAAGMRAAIRASAVVAVPSLLEDVHPTIVIEALANGRPVLGTPLGGIPHLIGPAGWVASPTAAAFTGALRTAVRQAPRLGNVARERYLALFTPEQSVRRLIEVYRAAIRR